MSERELSVDEKKAILKILLLSAGRLWAQVAAKIKENSRIDWRKDPEVYRENSRQGHEYDMERQKKLKEAEPIFLSLTKEDRAAILFEIEKQLAVEHLDIDGMTPSFDIVKNAMEWNDPEKLAKTITQKETSELLGKAVREEWPDDQLRQELESLIKSKWGEEALEDAQITVSVKDRMLSYEGFGPGFDAHVKEDGSMYTPEEVVGIVESSLRGKEDEPVN
ncbi:MAG: hypothetical protein HYT15_03940 [Candidatus Magasanikbacteria bacterium]|nr:hypothetical protein [Candidatus Magasanikbacteria bacterium]